MYLLYFFIVVNFIVFYNSAISEDGKIITARGADGKDGVNGKSAYEIAVANGFSGTEAEWAAQSINKIDKITVNGTEVSVADKTAAIDLNSYLTNATVKSSTSTVNIPTSDVGGNIWIA